MSRRSVYSYNVNGIRAAVGKGLIEWISGTSPDILCLQEIKALPEQIDLSEFKQLGYTIQIHAAVRKGYSGVLTLSKEAPKQVLPGIGIEKYDVEGRVLRSDFSDFTLLNVYFPSGTSGEVRQEFKMQFLSDFSHYVANLRQQQPRILICGDFNICHKPIDINHPERHKKSSGFLPEERAWFDEFIKFGMRDTFRMFCTEGEKYSWWSYRAGSRPKNLGWRIDYHLVSDALSPDIISAGILPDVFHSDHCPVYVELTF